MFSSAPKSFKASSEPVRKMSLRELQISAARRKIVSSTDEKATVFVITEKEKSIQKFDNYWSEIREGQIEKPLPKHVLEQVEQHVPPPVKVVSFEEQSRNLQEFHKTLGENPTPIPVWNGARILPQYGLTDGFPVWEKKLKSSIKGFYKYSNISLWRFNGTSFIKIGHETGSAKYIGPCSKIRF